MIRFGLIGDLIKVPPVQTVISLEDGRDRPEEILANFVFTSEVQSHFSVISDAFLKDYGRGFFLQGDFGSGKSHFLASLAAWLEDKHGAEVFSGRHGGLRRFKESGRNFLTVDISLINFRGSTPLERIIIESVEKSLVAHGVEVNLTPLSAFLKYLSTLLEEVKLASAFAEQVGILANGGVIDKYLNENPRRSYTEGIRFMKSIGIQVPEILVEERYETFSKALKAVKDSGFDGLVIVMDELSEFFRSKTDARNLNEDARTLQLLGELATGEPLWIIAAVQESIERTGDISQVTFRKIKDRFPVKFVLSRVHIKALISERLVKKTPEADKSLYKVYEYFHRQFPSFKWNYQDFQAYYPVHPVTISLLDGLGDLFSEHRGIVDFVHSQIAGDKARHIPGILDRPAYELLGPDSIYEHFAQKMSEFSGFNIYTRHIVPHLDEVIEKQIEDDDDRMFARRIVRILILYRIHPTAQTPSARELAEFVSCALSDHDPNLNVQFVTEAILDILVEKSKFLSKSPSDTKDPLDAVYEIVTEEDPSKTLKARISRAASEIPYDDTRLITSVLKKLPGSSSWPGLELPENGVYRSINWLNSNRMVFVTMLTGREKDVLYDRILSELSSGNADFAFVVGIGKTDFKAEHTAVWEIPLPVGENENLILREFFATKQIYSALNPANPSDAPLIETARNAMERLTPVARQTVLKIFYGGKFSSLKVDLDPVIRRMQNFDRLLDEAGKVLLEARYPGYRNIAPVKITPLPRLYQKVINDFIFPGSISFKDSRSHGITDIIEGLATPLGLVEVKKGSYVFSPDPEKHPLLSSIFGLISASGETGLKDVMHSLKTGRFGLPEDTACFVLAALAFGGLITLLKNKRAVSLERLNLTSVKNVDTLAPGEVIGRYDRETLINECAFLVSSGNWESFGLRQQREAWQAVVKFKDWAIKMVSDVGKRLEKYFEFSAFEAFDLGKLNSRMDALITLSEEIKSSYAAREGLERFLQAWRGNGFTADHIDYIKKLQRFLAKGAEQFVFINHYVRHASVERAASGKKEIDDLKNHVMHLLTNPDEIVTDEDTGRLEDTFNRFRMAYSDYYTQKHDEYYRQFIKKPLSRFAQRAIFFLKRLASIEILDRPFGLKALFAEIEGSKTKICPRNLVEELMRSPVCNCAFIPGETPPPVKKEDTEEIIEKCLTEYLVILKKPKIKEAIAARIFALVDADPERVKRLRSLVNILEDEQSSASALLDVFDDITAKEVSESLTGKVKIERRGLDSLYSSLGGRRLAPDQVKEIVTGWISASGENTVIAIEDDYNTGKEKGGADFSWWSMMHPELFKTTRLYGIRDIDVALERRYPSLDLKDALGRLDDGSLISFMVDEPFHLKAITMAWIILTERIIMGAPWPIDDSFECIPEPKYADRKIAGKIKERLHTLNKIARFNNALLPDSLRLRIYLARMLVDTWTTVQLRILLDQKLKQISGAGEKWLDGLEPVEVISLKDNPVVMILDGVSPDVWLEALDTLKCNTEKMEFFWFRLEAEPATGPGVSAMFGFSDDAIDELAARKIPYHHIHGNEIHGIFDLLPPFPDEKPIIFKVALIDEGAHGERLRLGEMPEALGRFLENGLPGLLELCKDKKRRLILTTDHGLSLTAKGLSHGRGGVFEKAVFRAQWRME